MTIDKGPVKYNYDGIKVAYYSECEYSAVQAKDDSLFATRDTVGVSYKFYQELSFDTHFIEPCSPINIGFPLQDWVVIPTSLNKLDITLTEYNKNDANLKQVLVQYRPIGGDGSWTNISTIPKANLTDVFTQYQWNTQLFKDGLYEIRAVAECTNPSLAPGISTVIKGSIERNPPELVGIPQPGDGTWDPGDEISITFNKPINCDKVIQADILANNTIGLYDATTNKLVDARISCVGNKIIIVPNVNPVFYENRTFRVIVSGKNYDDDQLKLNPNHQAAAIRDKVGNMIPKSIVWEFAVNQNSLEWVGTDIIETNVVLHPFSVKRQVRNRGGTIMQFRMEDFPFWLTISPSTGTLNPGQTADITFTFQQDMLIGDYLANINMVGSQGKEPLKIDYRVRCQPPVREVQNINEFSGSMNMVVKLNIFGQESMDPSDIIIAKIGGQIRGVGNVSYSRSLSQWLTFMTIYGNDKDAGKNIEFNVWDGSACSEYSEVLEVINYNDGDLIGSPINPQDLHVINLVQKCIPLAKGWNWISLNLDLLNNSVGNVLKSFKHKNNSYLIKDDDRFANFYTEKNLGWKGSLDTLKPQKRYMLYVDQQDTLCIKGKPYIVTQNPIPIVKDWNWIGYVPQTGMTVSQALASLTPLNGDLIKDQTRFAQYVAGNGWVGNLSFLEAPKGYLIKISNPGILNFPKTNSTGNSQNGIDKEPLISFSGANMEPSTSDSTLHFDFRKYNSTMNSIAIVKGIDISPNDELRAYIKGELRGIVPSGIYKLTNESLFFMTLYGNDDEVFEFRLFKADRKKEYTLTGDITFETDALKGLVEKPFELNMPNGSLQLSQISIENQVITQPSVTFNTVSVPASLASNVTCGKFSFNTVLAIGTNNLRPTCTLPTGFQNNMNGTVKVFYNELSNFVSINDRLIFTDPANNNLVVGCGTSTAYDGQILFNFTVKGGNSSTSIPIDLSYYSDNLKTTFLLKSGINYLKDLVVGSMINPYLVDFSPLKVSMDNNGTITSTVTNPNWTGKYSVDVFAMNCSGGNDQKGSFYFQRLKTVDCVELTSSNNAPFCAGNTLNLTSSQGASSYAWTGPDFSSTERNPVLPNASYSKRGTYTVTATHSSGCISTSTTTVSIYELPVPTINNVVPICAGTKLNLLGGGIGTYAWTGPDNFTSTLQDPSISSASVLASGVYTLIVTNANLCSSTATTSVIINSTPATPMPAALAPVIFGSKVTLTATGCTGTLKWYKTSGDTLLLANTNVPTITTQYYAKCEITANGITCIGLKSANITATVLNPSPPVSSGATICSGSPVSLTATGCSGGVGTFMLKWYQNSDNALVIMPVSPSVPTDYYSRCEQTLDAVTAVSGKSNVVTFIILSPTVPVAVGGTIYQGDGISLTATGCTGTGFTVRWFQSSDNVLVSMPVSPTGTSQYYAKCEQIAGGVTCLGAKSNDITVKVINRIFVDINKISASIQNGNSWATAYGNLQTGLASATANVEVWVAKGIYKPTLTIDRTISFSIPNNVIIYGGFAGTENTLSQRVFTANVSILSGDIGTQNVDADNSYHVVIFNGSSNTTVLNGFTITGGSANFNSRGEAFSPTAPTPIMPSTTTIETGGGIAIQNGGVPKITNCTVINNSAVFGGGLFAGDASMPIITDCKFMGNQATFGAGIHLQDGSNASINNCLLSGNKGIGGIYNNASSPLITNCTLAGNGGSYGGIYNTKSQPIVKNSIIWGNSSPSLDTQPNITYSIVEGGNAGIGNLNYDPQFVTPNPQGISPTIGGDYHLKANSLAINRGDNGSISLTDVDLEANLRRFAGERVDMGAYEFQGTAIARLVISIQTGNWESNLTWDIGSIPLLSDYVIIDQNHVITINQTGVAKKIEYRGTGAIKFNSPSSKLNIGF